MNNYKKLWVVRDLVPDSWGLVGRWPVVHTTMKKALKDYTDRTPEAGGWVQLVELQPDGSELELQAKS